MSEKPVSVEEIIGKVGVTIAAIDRKTLSYVDLSPTEREIVGYVFDIGVEFLKRVSPVIASDIARQKELALTMAGVAKATFPIRKNYQFPSVPGTLGVAWLFPQAIKYAADVPTSYKNNSWDMDLTAGTKAYLFGSDTAFYKASGAENKHAFILVFENGVIEVGTTPAVEQFRIISEAKGDYGAYSVEPLIELPIEKGVAVYQYPTPLGAMFVDHQRGIKWYFMPRVTKTATIKLLGLVFYEHDFFADTLWI